MKRMFGFGKGWAGIVSVLLMMGLTGTVYAGPLSSIWFYEAEEMVERADAAMGDWQGVWLDNNGGKRPLVAQVMCLGKEGYQANILPTFDVRVEPIAVLKGQRQGDTIRFEGGNWKGQIGEKLFAGTANWNGEGKFMLRKVYRVSPTMGMKAPDGAVILFDGTNTDQWMTVGRQAGIINLAKLIGGEQSAGYMYGRVWSEKTQDAVLELGSDDGIKVWLNNEMVHVNNVMRGLRAGEDKVAVTLKQGWNHLLLKVLNGGGGWEACARFVGNDGKVLDLLEAETFEMDEKGTNAYLKKNSGFITAWRVSGPYNVEGKQCTDLVDVEFQPENDWQNATWKTVGPAKEDPAKVEWKLVPGGAMEVTGGTIITKQKFDDYQLHIEFSTPFMPDARGQGRGNSGVYNQGRYEVQVLDSYGLEGADNECGGIYQVGRPIVNMCLPPLQWQTYDIFFTSAKFDKDGKKVKNAMITVKHNDVVVQDSKEIPGPTGSSYSAEDGTPGGIMLQDHGNPVRYRNIWIMPM